jgi:acyl dehydratase
MRAAKPAWEIGDELEERTFPPITRSQLTGYADASGDHNPIHTMDEAAEEVGLPGVIAHGMLTAATMGLLFSPYLEHGYVKELQARFSGMVYPGDELTVGGCVSGQEDSEDGCVYTFEVYASNGQSTIASGAVGFLVFGD